MIIYAINIREKIISDYLNLAKYICAPKSKTEVHLSIRGPYKRSLSQKLIDNMNNIIGGTKIHLKGFGNFFEYGQNTVFLQCESDILPKVWEKKEYPYNPHLTLYDGKDKEFASILFETLSKMTLDIEFTSTSIVKYDTKAKQILGSSFMLSMYVPHELLQKYLSDIDLDKCSHKDKTILIERVFRDLILELNS